MTESDYGYLARNVNLVHQRMVDACRRVGRSPDEVVLVAVSKTMPAEAVCAAAEIGLLHFGENRVEDALPKIAHIAESMGETAPLTWHMVGHLQRRKVRDAMLAFDIVQSVDSVRLAVEMSRRLAPIEKIMPVLLEINVSGEAAKYGFTPAETPAAVREILDLPHLRIRGLMTMAPLVDHAEEARPVFQQLRRLRDELRSRFPEVDWSELSMGMTDDFEPAIEEGATMVRVGRAIFSPSGA